jgi:integrase
MRYGDGVITKERGRYRVRLPIGGGKYKTIASGCETLKEARQLLNAAREERAKLKFAITLRQVGDAWLHSIRDLKSWDQIESQWRTIVMDAPFADQPVRTLERPEVDAWARALPQKRKKRSVLKAGERTLIELDAPISRKSASLALGYLKLCLAFAVKERHAEINAAADVEIPLDRHEVTEPVSYLSAREVDLLLESDVLTLEQRTVFTLAVFQGLREGELAGMDWSRVDWEGHGWWVARSWGGTTKNRKTRWQALVERAEQALRTWWERAGRPTRGIVFPSPYLDDHDQPKRYAKGHDWGWADNPEHHVTRLGLWRRVGIRTRIRFHDFRDTCATHLLSGTWGPPWPVKLVSEHLGHSSTAVTEARYAHTTREALRRHAAGVRFAKKPAARPAAVVGSAVDCDMAQTPDNTGDLAAPEVGLEPTTNRLTAVSPAHGFRVLTGDSAERWQIHQDPALETLADRLLALVEARLPVSVDLCRKLATSDLERAASRASAVLSGGAHALDSAIAIAIDVVLRRREAVARAVVASGGEA